MNRTLKTTAAAVVGCILVGGSAMANVISIDDTPGRTQPVAPVEVSPSPAPLPVVAEPAPVPVPPAVSAPTAPQTVSPPAPHEVSDHDGPAHDNPGPGVDDHDGPGPRGDDRRDGHR